MDYKEKIIMLLDKINDRKMLKVIYKFICYCYARA